MIESFNIDNSAFKAVADEYIKNAGTFNSPLRLKQESNYGDRRF
jgi:hypothetical protein